MIGISGRRQPQRTGHLVHEPLRVVAGFPGAPHRARFRIYFRIRNLNAPWQLRPDEIIIQNRASDRLILSVRVLQLKIHDLAGSMPEVQISPYRPLSSPRCHGEVSEFARPTLPLPELSIAVLQVPLACGIRGDSLPG